MFYQTYRPQKFKDLIGNDSIVASITGAIKKGTLPHAFFFSGGRGSGKTTTARLIAKTLNCENPIVKKEGSNSHIHLEPCGKCKNCLSVSNGNHLDLIEIDAASNRGIDNIRDIKETIGLSPTLGTKKIYIIDEVHMLTREASNALLKTLEEPPAHAYFVLCTTNPEKVLPTIKSRCIQHQFIRPSVSDIVKKLKKIVKSEGLEISDEELTDIAVSAKGAYRDAETILEQVVNSNKNASFTLGKIFSFNEFLLSLLSKDAKGAIKFVSDMYEKGIDLDVWGENLIMYLRSLILQKIGVRKTNETNVVDVSVADLKLIIDLFSTARNNMMYASIATLPFEMAIIEYCGFLKPKESVSPLSINEVGKTKSKNGGKDGKDSIGGADVINNNKKDKGEERNVSSKPEKIAEKKEVVGKERGELKSEKVKKTAKVKKEFPYKQLIESLKPQNHSIYLIMSSCKLSSFDGKVLNILADFSFHKERLMSNKVRGIIEKVASELVNGDVILNCQVAEKGKNLTDKNVVQPPSKVNLEEVFESVFGEDLL